MKKQRIISILTVLILLLGVVNQAFAQTTPSDRDSDGIPNHLDGCPDLAGPRSNNGCPIVREPHHDIPDDTDGDGTADPLDQCPTVPGDGANGGCPEGTDPNAPSTPSGPQLVAAPDSDACIASPAGSFGVNMRDTAHPDGNVVHVLQVNEWAEVFMVVYQGESPHLAEHEQATLLLPFGLQAPFIDPDPEPIDDIAVVEPPLWLGIRTDDGILGWVLESLMRYGGNCSNFDLPDDDIGVLELLVLQAEGNSVGFPNENPFIIFPVVPDPDPNPTFDFILILPDDDGSLDLAAECVWVELGSGGSLLECVDGSTPLFIYCLIQPGNEAGIFQEVCYEVEVPEGCTVTTSEAGVWHFECDEDGEVDVTPFGEDLPILNVHRNDDAVLISLLLPAIQKIRE